MYSYMMPWSTQINYEIFHNSQFGHCPLIWINESWELKDKINKIHELALHIVYIDKKSTFDELLEKGNFVKIHIKYLQVLVMEMFEVQNETSPAIRSRVFPIIEQNYILRKNSNFVSRRINAIHYG